MRVLMRSQLYIIYAVTLMRRKQQISTVSINNHKSINITYSVYQYTNMTEYSPTQCRCSHGLYHKKYVACSPKYQSYESNLFTQVDNT